MRPLTLSRLLLQCLILAVILFCVMVLALKFGAIHVSLYGLGRDLLRVFLGKSSEISSEYSLILNLRLPRILLGAFVGAALAIAGTSFQALLRNPLADPYVLGVSNGQIDSSTLLLGGVIIASLLSALIVLLLTTLPSSNFRGMAYWMMGELSSVPSQPLAWVLRVGFLVAAVAIYATASDLNLLLAGEKEAMHLGVDVRRVRIIVYIAASALTGLAVSVSGAVGYVGLLIPHLMRMIYGADHRILIPASAFGGAIAVVIADILARTIAAPNELPVGAITAIAGAPLFIYLLRRRLA